MERVANPTPAALAALTELSELQALLDAYVGAECRNAYIRGIDSTSSWHEEDEADVKTPRLALMTKLSALLAAARQGEEDAAAKSLREAAGCAFDAIDISGASEEAAREARNILGPALTAYDTATVVGVAWNVVADAEMRSKERDAEYAALVAAARRGGADTRLADAVDTALTQLERMRGWHHYADDDEVRELEATLTAARAPLQENDTNEL